MAKTRAKGDQSIDFYSYVEVNSPQRSLGEPHRTDKSVDRFRPFLVFIEADCVCFAQHVMFRVRRDSHFAHNHDPIQDPKLVQPAPEEGILFDVTDEAQLTEAELQHLKVLAEARTMTVFNVRTEMNDKFKASFCTFNYDFIRRFIMRVRMLPRLVSSFPRLAEAGKAINQAGGKFLVVKEASMTLTAVSSV